MLYFILILFSVFDLSKKCMEKIRCCLNVVTLLLEKKKTEAWFLP